MDGDFPEGAITGRSDLIGPPSGRGVGACDPCQIESANPSTLERVTRDGPEGSPNESEPQEVSQPYSPFARSGKCNASTRPATPRGDGKRPRGGHADAPACWKVPGTLPPSRLDRAVRRRPERPAASRRRSTSPLPRQPAGASW